MTRYRFLISLLAALLVHAAVLTALPRSGVAPDGPGLAVTLADATGGRDEGARAEPTAAGRDRRQAVPQPEQPRPREDTARPATDTGEPQPVARNRQETAPASTDAPSGSGTGAPAAEPGNDRARAYLARVRRIIGEQRRYPEEAERRRIEGRVTVTFVIGAGGRVVDVAIAESSGSRLLDEATERMFATLVFPPPPRQLGERLSLSIPVNWELN